MPNQGKPVSEMTVPEISHPPRMVLVKPASAIEERELVFVVAAEDLTTIQDARALVVLQVPGVAGGVVVVHVHAARRGIDLMRVRVIQFKAEAVFILLAKACLEAVVRAGLRGRLQPDVAKAWIRFVRQALGWFRASRLQTPGALPSECSAGSY